MDSLLDTLRPRVPAAGLIGYLNFSDGRPDPRWQGQLDAACRVLAEAGDPAPWLTLPRFVEAECERLRESGAAAFRDTAQAQAAARLAFAELPARYRAHHRDLLAHQSDGALFGPLFLARAAEAVLAQGGPWDEDERIITGAIGRLNDFVGHRPIAVLETRAQTEYYPHEKVRPVPLWLRGVGAGLSRYEAVLARALELLRAAPPELLGDATLDPEQFDEVALDPRAYDHQHPANRRPNYLFGEWDPHAIDNAGRYRRFVLRQNTLDALADWVPADGDAPTGARGERVTEAATVLAAIMLMAAGVSGAGPNHLDSSLTLTKLVPRIARYRDRFYQHVLDSLGGPHAERLREEAGRMRQPFAGIRSHLNQALARQRAYQLQERVLSLAFANLGYPEASRRRASRIPTVSVRLLAEASLGQTAARFALEAGRPGEVTALLAEVESLLKRGIECGALADPWNILGHQGLFPLFVSREDSVRDPRAEELVHAVGRQFGLYAQATAALALAGDAAGRAAAERAMGRLADWWDRFATPTVNDMPRVHGGERREAAARVADALAAWERRDAGGNDIAFWRGRRDGFRSAAAFAQVVEAMLRHRELRPAFALLMTWLSEAGTLPLEDGDASFARLIQTWFADALSRDPAELAGMGLGLGRVFELMEANADGYDGVPESPFGPGSTAAVAVETDELPNDYEYEDVYGAAYDEVTYRDSTDDGVDSALAGDGPPETGDFPADSEADALEDRLGFLKTVASLWRQAAAHCAARPDRAGAAEDAPRWWERARRLQRDLEALLGALNALPVPKPFGPYETLVEYDRRRAVKEGLIEEALGACVEARQAERALGALLRPADAPEPADWREAAVALEAAVQRGDANAVRDLLPLWLAGFGREPLLFVPLSAGGDPRAVLRARTAQSVLRGLVERLPRLGLLRETFHLVRLARSMEQRDTTEGRKVTEFDRLFRVALGAVVEALLDAAPAWPDDPAEDAGRRLTEVLRKVADSFLTLWISHSQSLRLSVLESMAEANDWERTRAFIKDHGRELFTVSFLALANLRGILAHGTGAYLDSLAEADDARAPAKLVAALESGEVDRDEAARTLETVLSALVEHYDEYRDYNATTAQSDYGENIVQLFEFLLVKVRYERYAWRMRPMVQAHEILCRRGHEATADRWRDSIGDFTAKLAGELLADLAKVEQSTALRLRTVRDRLEERFVQPLALDRLCARVGPTAKAANGPRAEAAAALARFEALLKPFEDLVAGNGMDPPPWLRQLDAAVRKSRDAAEPAAPPAPAAALTLDALRRQLDEWDRPLEAAG